MLGKIVNVFVDKECKYFFHTCTTKFGKNNFPLVGKINLKMRPNRGNRKQNNKMWDNDIYVENPNKKKITKP